MSPTELLRSIAQELREARQVPPPTVREFLSWFGAQRRGYSIVQRIRHTLKDAGVLTEPDFESAYIDSPVRFVLASEMPIEPAEHPETGELAGTASGSATASGMLTAAPTYSDPTYRISKLASANKSLTCVAPDATLQSAVTVMLLKDYSQLPVMTNERDVKGVISWRSIGRRLALQKRAD